jgi:hypothetical protein
MADHAPSDPTEELLMIIGIFTHFFALETTLAERQFFRALAKLVGRRAARLSSCGIAAIVSKMGYLEEGCSVGADGSLYNVCRLRRSPLRSGISPIPVTEISRVRRSRARRPTGHIRRQGTVSNFAGRGGMVVEWPASLFQEHRDISCRRRKRCGERHHRRCAP